jgi:V/A-type H+-transporting ATPase subunit E
MSTQRVTDKIIEDAKREAQDILAKYKDDAARIEKEFAERIVHKKNQVDTEIEEIKKTEIMRALSQKRLDLNKKITEQKQKLITATVDEAVSKLLVHKQYLDFLKALIKNSGEKEGELLLSKNDVKRYRSDLENHIKTEGLNLKIATGNDMMGGIVISREKTNHIGSLNIILELLSDELAITVSKVLY